MVRERKILSYSKAPSSHVSSSTKAPKKKKKKASSTRTQKRGPGPLFVGGEPTAPTTKEWDKMTPFQNFIVVDPEGTEHRFPHLNYALILPEGADPEGSLRLRDFWVGKIKEIRSRNDDPSDVWVRTQWLMSIDDLKQHIEVDAAPFGKMERILSNHIDFVHTSCFSDLAQVQDYVEDEVLPKAINDETFYYRYTFDVYSRELKPVPEPTCFCGEMYNPNESGVMHFCPRKGCCVAFHAACLRRVHYVQKPPKGIQVLQTQRALQFERTLPDPSEDEEHEYSRPPASTASSSRTLVAPSGLPITESLKDPHSQIPAELLALARSPMVKGQGSDLPFEWSCVTGNYAVVTRARRRVHDIVDGGEMLPLKWRALLEIPGSEGESVGDLKAWVVSDDNLFLCPKCKGAI